jgi:hypothetical protein
MQPYVVDYPYNHVHIVVVMCFTSIYVVSIQESVCLKRVGCGYTFLTVCVLNVYKQLVPFYAIL